MPSTRPWPGIDGSESVIEGLLLMTYNLGTARSVIDCTGKVGLKVLVVPSAAGAFETSRIVP